MSNPIHAAVDARVAEVREWRHTLHRHPELDFAVERTASFVAERLERAGFDEVVSGVGRTGVVGLIEGRGSTGGTVGLRADMDALPIMERSGRPWASETPGRMHACGHDGHTAMLLGAATLLAERRDFDGRVAVVFQPAEESSGGGREMVEDGLMERFGIDAIYGLHNWPGLPVGRFATRAGPFMASADQFDLVVEGRGGHAALPHRCIDTVTVAAEIVLAIHRDVSRRIDPLSPAVVSLTTVATDGDTYNVLPTRVTLRGTARALDAPTRAALEALIRRVASATARASEAACEVVWHAGYPVTVNDTQAAVIAAESARAAVGGSKAATDAVDAIAPPSMGSEDFSYMLEARPGAFIFLGNGESASLHHPEYDFDDAALAPGMRYWLELVPRALAELERSR